MSINQLTYFNNENIYQKCNYFNTISNLITFYPHYYRDTKHRTNCEPYALQITNAIQKTNALQKTYAKEKRSRYKIVPVAKYVKTTKTYLLKNRTHLQNRSLNENPATKKRDTNLKHTLELLFYQPCRIRILLIKGIFDINSNEFWIVCASKLKYVLNAILF